MGSTRAFLLLTNKSIKIMLSLTVGTAPLHYYAAAGAFHDLTQITFHSLQDHRHILLRCFCLANYTTNIGHTQIPSYNHSNCYL